MLVYSITHNVSTCYTSTLNIYMTTNTFKHSGTLGDLIYSLPIVKHFGGGDFLLHLHQIDWIGKHFYGAEPSPFHKGRMTMNDFNFMKSFMEAQPYINKFEVMDPKTAEVTHNLDKFRVPFVGHPGNYVDIYSDVFNITDPAVKEQLRNETWLTVPKPRPIEGKGIVINRTGRWLPPTLHPLWNEWKSEGHEDVAVFIGLPEEHVAFKEHTGWDIPHHPTKDLLEMAEIIAGADMFIGNQSVAFSIAVGLGHANAFCEARRDLPIERNECYFPFHEGIFYI